jgi:hypothetical protein
MGGLVFSMVHLDYLSCFLTILATLLLARKSWIGLLVAIVNSLIVCAIGLRTSQLGFIPANLFCICVYAFNMRPWFKDKHRHIEIRPGVADHTYTELCTSQRAAPIVATTVKSSVLNLASATKIIGLPEEHRAR